MSPMKGMSCEVSRMGLTVLPTTEDRFATQAPPVFVAAQSFLAEPAAATAWSKTISIIPCVVMEGMAMASQNKG
jgi:hypothetical protein